MPLPVLCVWYGVVVCPSIVDAILASEPVQGDGGVTRLDGKTRPLIVKLSSACSACPALADGS